MFSDNHYCCGRAINISYSERVAEALFIQIAIHMCRIVVIFGLSDRAIYFHIILKKRDFGKKRYCHDIMKLLDIFRSFAYGPKNKVPYRGKCFLAVPVQNDLNLKDAFQNFFSFYIELLGKPKKTRGT